MNQIPETVDVAVIGGGLAGYCAAFEAAVSGANVVLLEREARNGGATVLSGGSFAFAGTDLQRRLGIEDSSQLLYDDLRHVGGHENDEKLVRVYVDAQAEAYRWLRGHGVAFDKVFIASGQSVPRAHSRNAREVLDLIVGAAGRSGVRTLLSTRARRLVQDRRGRIDAVEVESGASRRAVRVRRGVVLATGGFSRNDRLLRLFAPGQAAAQRMGGAGNQGDGLLMAWKLGADFRDMGYIKGTYGSHVSAGPEDHFISFPIYAGAIAVNRAGRRFIDESTSYKLIGDACLQQQDHRAVQIFDQRVFDRAQPGIPAMDFAADLAAGRIVQAADLRTLAAAVGVDPEGLAATVAEFNRAIDAGAPDPLGRTGLCNGFGALQRLEQGPWYGYVATSVVLATYCGLRVDERMRVLDVFGQPLEGLHAAGGVVGGFHGVAYMTGTANGKATIFGRIAGRNAAAGP